VHEEIIFTGNIDPMVAGEADHLKAFESLRRLGAKLQAMNENISSLRLVFLPLRWFLSKQGYDLRRAGRGLIGLSNSLALTDGSRAHQINSIQAGLKLPPPIDRQAPGAGSQTAWSASLSAWPPLTPSPGRFRSAAGL
jgi:hypothetical protein